MITLYTTHCPKCRVIEKKLAQKGIKYSEVTDINEMEKLGFKSAPMLKVGDDTMDFMAANKWIASYEGE